MAINSSGLKELRSGSVRTQWVFESFEEMASYLFDYMELDADPECEGAMAKLLGDRRMSAPLHVEDITRFWLLAEA